MATRDNVAHLLRRFGLGASQVELDELTPLGYEGALRWLVFDKDRPEPPAAPSEFFWMEKEEAQIGTWRLRPYWIYRMVTTKRPMQEKLALFWHNHFAVSDNKVEDGTMMQDYLQILHEKGQGNFGDLLQAIATNPAMMRYLDMNRSLRGNPNENWAREVMELFTLGIGNYSEDDVKEVARAFTGWGYVQTFWEMPGNSDEKLKESLKYDRPFSSFAYMPAMHDPSPKKILGKTSSFDGEGVLKLLAEHPITARRMATKLWEFFAYPDPEPEVVERIARVFQKSRGNIRTVMMAIGKSPEFLSEKAVRRIVKSPVDYCVAISRQMGAGSALADARKAEATRYDRIPPSIVDHCGYLGWFMERQGLSLLYPPDVSGWRWDKAWATQDAMANRFSFRGYAIWGTNGPGEGSRRVTEFLKAAQPADGDAVAAKLLEFFDVAPNASCRPALAKFWNDTKGIENVNKGDAAWLIDRSLGMIVASPEAQVV